MLSVALEGVRRLLNVRKTAFLAKNVSPRVARFLAGARWRRTVNDPDRVGRALRERGLCPSEEMVRAQVLFGGVAYRALPCDDTMTFDLFPVSIAERDGMRIALFDGLARAQYWFGIAENGSVLVRGDDWQPMASSLAKLIEGEALLDAQCRKWHHASWEWLPALAVTVPAATELLSAHVPYASLDHDASDPYVSWFVLGDACVSIGHSWDNKGKVWTRVFADGERRAKERSRDIATALGVAPPV